MKTIRSLIVLVLLLSLATGCRSLGKLSVERNKSLQDEAADITKIVSIEPSFEQATRKGGRTSKKYTENSIHEKELAEMLRVNAEKSGIQLTVIDAENLGNDALDYFNYLAPLRKETLTANFTQQADSRNNYEGKWGAKARTADLGTAPVISSRYSHLAQKYGTPYFAVHGVSSVIQPNPYKWAWLVLFPPAGLGAVLNPKADTYYYTIVVNVETAEVVYREIRISHDIANQDNLNNMIYDSFQILKRN